MVSLSRNHNILIDSMLVVELKLRISFLATLFTNYQHITQLSKII